MWRRHHLDRPRGRSQEVKDALRENTDALVSAGGCGAPTFVVRSGRDTTLVWGQDRLDAVVAGARAPPPASRL